MKEPKREMDSSAFVILADYVPNVIQEIRYHSTYNFIGERIDGYEEPAALITLEAARALKSAGKELYVMGYQMKIFDAYRPARATVQPQPGKHGGSDFAGDAYGQGSRHGKSL